MRVGISACSDGQFKEWKKQNEELGIILYKQGIEAVFAKHIYAKKDSFSGTDKERAEDLMRFYQDDSIDAIYDYFTGIVCGDMVQNSKPNPEIYLKACELLGANPVECYALEDSKNGLLSAYKAGCKTIMVPDLWQPDDEILSIIAGKYEDLDEVKDAFERFQE